MNERSILYLSQDEVENLNLSVKNIIEGLENMFRLKGENKVEMPPKPGIHTRKDAFIHAMPAYIPEMCAAGMKWVSGYPENHKYNLPYISGLMILNDPENGLPIAIMDCIWLTAKRTGAATAVAAKYLARQDSSTLGILGCGVQGESNLEALMVVQDGIKTVYTYDIFEQKAIDFIERVKLKYPGVRFIPVETPKEAVEKSDIVVTAGPIVKNPKQTIEAEWFKEGAFASPVDFDSYWKPEAMKLSDKYCTDDIGQYNYYKKVGYFVDTPSIHADLGEIVIGKKIGRENNRERIMCVNLGIALEDVAIGKIIYNMAKKCNIGIELPL